MLINEYMLKLLRKKAEEVVDLPLSTALPYPDILSYVSRKDDTVKGVNPNPIETELADLAPGERFQVAIAYLVDARQELIGKMISVRNVTAARMAEESKHQFIAHVAHELLTPLTNIKSYSEMLMCGEVSDRETQREFYNTINEETDRLARLVQNLLNISKMELGSLTINKGMVRTDWFVEGCLSAIEASAREKHLSIEKRLPETFPVLVADKELIKGAIINILGNALKYTPEQGKITFVIDDQMEAVTFEVIDTGYGISQEDLPRIFDKFFRSSNPQITTQAGSGLGLAITAEIVRLHGGEIDVKSQLGEGTHITIRIPKEEHYLGKE
jgi:signal transduction histidine kinase